MILNGEVTLNAPRDVIWQMLFNPDVLRACVPGCEELDRNDDTHFQSVTKIKVGPIAARFKGQISLEELDPPNGCKIIGQGEGGVAGFAKGAATVTLTAHGDGTLLVYLVEAQIGGKLAQLGQRLISGTAKKLADDFFSKLAKTAETQTRNP